MTTRQLIVLPLDPFNRSRLPGDFSRDGRVQLLGEAFQALLDDKPLSREAALFLGGAGMAWLESGGDLVRDYLKVCKAKSHRTPAAIWRELQARHPDERQHTVNAATLATLFERTHHHDHRK